MGTSPSAATVPPVEIVLCEVVTSLAFAAHAYLNPPGDEAARGPNLEHAELALDVAGHAFDRISQRLESSERSSIARMLTELRLSYVQKRG